MITELIIFGLIPYYIIKITIKLLIKIFKKISYVLKLNCPDLDTLIAGTINKTLKEKYENKITINKRLF